MEKQVITDKDFNQQYWKYYLMLEKDLLDTERYLAINELIF